VGIFLAFVANNNTDWLLVSYSGNGINWEPSQQVGSQSSKHAPAISFFPIQSRIFALAYVADNATNTLLTSYALQAGGWSPDTEVQDQSSKRAPALAVFNSKLWVVFVANNSSNELLVCSSSDGQNWSASTEVKQSSKAAPALAVFDNKLWVVFVANNSSNELLVCSSSDGQNWSASTEVRQSSKAAPAIFGLDGAIL
jgi:hypothetical protein